MWVSCRARACLPKKNPKKKIAVVFSKTVETWHFLAIWFLVTQGLCFCGVTTLILLYEIGCLQCAAPKVISLRLRLWSNNSLHRCRPVLGWILTPFVFPKFSTSILWNNLALQPRKERERERDRDHVWCSEAWLGPKKPTSVRLISRLFFFPFKALLNHRGKFSRQWTCVPVERNLANIFF